MGIANIIPGVSGGTLAIILGIYEKLIDVLSSFWKNLKKNILFVLPLLIGMGIALIAGSFVIDWGLKNFPIATTLFFVGLVIGGIPFIYMKVHKKYNVVNVIIFIIIFALVVLLSILTVGSNVSLDKIDFLLIVKLFFVGAITAATMIIPGISGSLVLMNMGYYESIVECVKNLTKISSMGHSICVLLPFGIGVIIGLVLIAKLIKWLLRKFPIQSYFGILAFVIASIVSIIIRMDKSDFNIGELMLGILLMGIGIFITFILGWYDKNRTNNNQTIGEVSTIDSSSEEVIVEQNNENTNDENSDEKKEDVTDE
ncbi:MAG: DUF368 domain-containing protein [bacterium]|nr:DUF368 domain-containing protein [bacterium]